MTRFVRLWVFLMCAYAATHVLLMAVTAHAWNVSAESVALIAAAPLAQAAALTAVLKLTGDPRA